MRKPVHHGSQHWLHAHFAREGAAEVDQGPPVIEPVAIKEPIKASLRPVAKRLKQEGRDQNGGDYAAQATGPCGVKQASYQRDHCDVDGHYACGCRGVSQAPLEDNVYVHQAVAHDGVGEAKGQQYQRKRGEIHPGPWHHSERVGQYVQQRERYRTCQRAGRHPFQLLAHNAVRGALVAPQKNRCGQQKVESQVNEFELIERDARRQRGRKTQQIGRDLHVDRKQGRRQQISCDDPERAPGSLCFPAFREEQRKMHKQNGRQEHRPDLAPIDLPIKPVELAGIVK